MTHCDVPHNNQHTLRSNACRSADFVPAVQTKLESGGQKDADAFVEHRFVFVHE